MDNVTLETIMEDLEALKASTDLSQSEIVTEADRILTLLSIIENPLEREAALKQFAAHKDVHKIGLVAARGLVKSFVKEAQMGDAGDYFDEGGTYLPKRMIEALKAEYDIIALTNEKSIRIYANGVYRLDRGEHIERAMQERLGEAYQEFYLAGTLAGLRRLHLNEIHHEGHFPFAHPHELNLKNGILDLRDGKFREHSPEFKSLVQLPVRYDPDATCPAIDAFLHDVLKGNEADIQLAHEIAGYSMLMQLPIAVVFVLLGPTHTGKSTFIDIISALLGSENVSGISLQALDNDELRFARAGLFGKLANMAADMSKKTLAGDSNIKKISAADRFEVERKGVDSFPIRPFSTLICATNEMPVSRDKSDAWLERLVILPFTKQHRGKSAKRNYLEELTTDTELSGLLNHAIKAVQHVLDEGVFTETENTKAARKDYEVLNNTPIAFLRACFEESEFEDIREDETYAAYLEWCKAEGLKYHVNKTEFRKIWETAGIKRQRVRKHGKRPFMWKGLKAVDEDTLFHDTDTDDTETITDSVKL